MIGEVHQEATTHIGDSTELSPLTAQIIMIAFEETHKWLAHRGLKTDQVKNELMHYTKTKN